MSAADLHDEQAQLASENANLRQRVAELEAELIEVQARTNAVVAHWQERAYWLDRLHIDLNRIMERPGADQVRVTLGAVRRAFWMLKRFRRRLRGS